MGDMTKNFDRRDFTCHCAKCAENPASPATKGFVVASLQVVRDELGLPITVSRGVSCHERNAIVGGAKDSRHLPEHADAIDIACDSPTEAFVLVQILMKHFTVVRVYPHHIHIDCRPGAPMFLASPDPQGGC